MGLIFDGVDLEERFGVMVDGGGTWAKPPRDRELVHVPGRNGDLILDHGCWNNVTVEYRVLIKDGWQDRFEEFARWISRHRGYYKLEDPARHPDAYRMAEFADSIDPTLWFTTRTGVFDLTFNCKPQQFLYDGGVPLQRIVPKTSSTQLVSGYLPTDGNNVKITFIPEIDASVAGHVNGQIFVYNASKTVIASSTQTILVDGVKVDYAPLVSGAAYWRIFFTITTGNVTDLDKIAARVISTTVIDGKVVNLNAVFARKYAYDNPTGYKTKPLMVWRGKELYCTVNQFAESGEREDWYSFNLSDFSAKSDKAIFDCDLQYVYYDYLGEYDVKKKGNLGSYLYMTSAESEYGQALSFPELGDEVTEFYTYTGTDQDIALLEIYPRWWRI